MSRLAGWRKPGVGLREGAASAVPFAELTQARAAPDRRPTAWADALDPDWLAEDQAWFSGAAGRGMRRPCELLVAHLFNHQAHHRGQAHAMLTAAGAKPGDTDLMLLV